MLDFTFTKSNGWLEGDDGEVGKRRGVPVGKRMPPLIQEGSLLGSFTPLGPGCGSESLCCLLDSFTKNLPDDRITLQENYAH